MVVIFEQYISLYALSNNCRSVSFYSANRSVHLQPRTITYKYFGCRGNRCEIAIVVVWGWRHNLRRNLLYTDTIQNHTWYTMMWNCMENTGFDVAIHAYQWCTSNGDQRTHNGNKLWVLFGRAVFVFIMTAFNTKKAPPVRSAGALNQQNPVWRSRTSSGSECRRLAVHVKG